MKKNKYPDWYYIGMLKSYLNDFAFAGKFLLTFIISCIVIFYIPYRLGLMIDRWVTPSTCLNSILGVVFCWIQGLLGFAIAIGLTVAMIIIIYMIIIITIKLMDLF